MTQWYSYYGDCNSIPVYNFKPGVDGDVLNIPYGIQSISCEFRVQPNSLFGSTLYIRGTDGGTQTLNTEGSFVDNIIFNYSTDGRSPVSVALPGYWHTIKYNKDVNSFLGTGSSELAVYDDLYQKYDDSYA